MLLIIGTIRLPPENLGAARPAMARMAEASRAEAGCLDYAYAEDVLDPGLIRVMERWTDRAVLEAHFKTGHLAEWRACWPQFGIGERNLSLYVVGDSEAT